MELGKRDVRGHLSALDWLALRRVAAKEHKLSYHNKESLSFTVYPFS